MRLHTIFNETVLDIRTLHSQGKKPAEICKLLLPLDITESQVRKFIKNPSLVGKIVKAKKKKKPKPRKKRKARKLVPPKNSLVVFSIPISPPTLIDKRPRVVYHLIQSHNSLLDSAVQVFQDQFS